MCVEAGITNDTPPRSGDAFRCLHLRTVKTPFGASLDTVKTPFGASLSIQRRHLSVRPWPRKLGASYLAQRGSEGGDPSDPVLGGRDLSIRPAQTRQA